MLISLERHKDDYDVEKVKEAILNTESFEHIHLSKFGIFYFIDGGGNHCVYHAKFMGLKTSLAKRPNLCCQEISSPSCQTCSGISSLPPIRHRRPVSNFKKTSFASWLEAFFAI